MAGKDKDAEPCDDNAPVPVTIVPDPNQIVDTWKNRRRMAWASLIAMFMVTFYALVFMPESRLKTGEIVITWFYMATSSITGAYLGLSTWSDIKKSS